MTEMILTIADAGLLILFGVYLSAAFAGVRMNRLNALLILGLCLLCGALQGLILWFSGAEMVRKLYPLITHLPLVLFLIFACGKQPENAMVCVFTAYLSCQPVKWMGLLVFYLTENAVAEEIARVITLLLTGFLILKFFATPLSESLGKGSRAVWVFGIVPVVYYCFDYVTSVYTDLWASGNRLVVEFIPAFLCVTYMIFCVAYYRTHEQKAEAERKEQIIRIMVQQQAKEIEAVKRTEQEIRLLRHDMRLLLSSLAVCIENGETDSARDMIARYASRIEGTRLEHFCENDVVNCILSDFAAKCAAKNVEFSHAVELTTLKADEMLFCSILSNSLDNALNAQLQLPEERRCITLMLKNAEDKLLLSVKNPVVKPPTFVDGLPVTSRRGHGYGTQSIRYATERLGGNYQFSLQDGQFVVRVVL